MVVEFSGAGIGIGGTCSVWLAPRPRMKLAARETGREGAGLLPFCSAAVAVVVAVVGVVSPATPSPFPITILFGLDPDLVFDLETSLKRPKIERGRSVVAAETPQSVSLTLLLTVCKAAGVIGREVGFAAGAVVVGFSLLEVVVEAGCEALLLGRFLGTEGESTEAAVAGAMTREEGMEEEEEP